MQTPSYNPGKDIEHFQHPRSPPLTPNGVLSSYPPFFSSPPQLITILLVMVTIFFFAFIYVLTPK